LISAPVNGIATVWWLGGHFGRLLLLLLMVVVLVLVTAGEQRYGGGRPWAGGR